MVNMKIRALTQSVSVGVIGLLSLSTALSAQQHYKQTNLVSDTGVGGTQQDSHLVNAWGMSRSSTSPWWVSDNGMGVSTLYMGTGAAVPLVVTIPPGNSSNDTGTPTGQIFNGTTDFQLAPNKPAVFLFATEDGTISGWNPGVLPTTAKIVDSRCEDLFRRREGSVYAQEITAMTKFTSVQNFKEQLWKGAVWAGEPSLNQQFHCSLKEWPIQAPPVSAESWAKGWSAPVMPPLASKLYQESGLRESPSRRNA